MKRAGLGRGSKCQKTDLWKPGNRNDIILGSLSQKAGDNAPLL